MSDWTDITALHWQPALGRAGHVVTGVDDINQCIRIILSTPKGAVPHRPTFGCDLWRYIDRPLPAAIPHIIREGVDAIRRWEPRAQVIAVRPTLGDPGHLTIVVSWQPVYDVTQTYQAEVTL